MLGVLGQGGFGTVFLVEALDARDPAQVGVLVAYTGDGDAAAEAARGAAMQVVNGLRVTDDEALACVKQANGVVRVEIEALRSENLQLSSEILDLRQSPRAVERVAREELGLARPDETVLLIREDDPASPH